SGANGICALTFTAGTFDVNNLQIGFQTQAGTSAGVGVFNVNTTNAFLTVNSALSLGACGSGSSTNLTQGALNIFGGTATVNSIVVGGGSGTNSIAVNNGTLALAVTAGSPALPINTIAL